MKPPFTYYGGKTTLADRIVAALPSHEHYVEPFAGSLAVLLAKPPSLHETVNDIDGDLMTFWRVLRDRPTDLARMCALTPHSRLERQAASAWLTQPATARAVLPELEIARLVWVALTQGRAGLLRKTGWRYYIDPAGNRSASMPDYLEAYVDRMAAATERLRRVSLEARPALDLIDAYGGKDGVLLYVDPPYLGTARGEAGSPRQYRHEMNREDEHRELAKALHACHATVVLSGYPSPLYDELYADWHTTSLASATSQGGTWSQRTEVLWSNQAPANDLFGGAA